MKRTIEVVPYSPLWPTLFEKEANLIKETLGKNCIAVHHIGSTAVPELSAKPVIDMIPVVLDITEVDKSNSAMENLGYEAKGEYGIPFRRFFQKGGLTRTHHVHVFEKNNPEIERHLLFRDWMRSHEEDRELYANLKIKLAKKFPNDIDSYCLGKDDFIANIDAKTGFKQLRIVKALTTREWEAARFFRQKYFFDNVPVSDPYTWTFEHKDHVHFVLYQGGNVIGYAHIQLWEDKRAALRIIVIDEPDRHKGFGSDFLKKIERWLKLQGYKTLHIQSTKRAYPFYIRHQYTHMDFKDPEGHETDSRDVEIGKTL